MGRPDLVTSPENLDDHVYSFTSSIVPRRVPPAVRPAAAAHATRCRTRYEPDVTQVILLVEIVAIAMFRQMQSGTVDRAQLGEEFSIWLTEERVRDAAPRLKALGEPTKVEVQRVRERGGMEAARIQFKFASETLEANMFRSPDGKIQQFLLAKQ